MSHVLNPIITINRGQEFYYTPEFFVSCGCGWNKRVGTPVAANRPNGAIEETFHRAEMEWVHHIEWARMEQPRLRRMRGGI